MRSHGAGLLEAEPSGERRLGNDGCSGPAAPFPEPPDQSPVPASRSPPPRAARPAPPRPPRTAPRRAPPAPPPGPVPGAKQTNNASPAALLPLPLTARPPATSVSRAPSRLSAGAPRNPAAPGPPGDPRPRPDPDRLGGGGERGRELGSRIKVAIMPPPAAGPARQGGVPRSPARARPSPAPFLLVLPHLGATGVPREPLAAGSELRGHRRRRLGLGRPPRRVFAPPPPPPHAAPRALSLPPTHLARGCPLAGWRRRARRDALCSRRCGRRSRRARRGRAGAGGGGEAGGAAVPEPRAQRPAPARPPPLAPELEPNFFLLPFSLERSRQLVLGAGGRKRARAPQRVDTLPPVPVPPDAGSTTKSHLHARK